MSFGKTLFISSVLKPVVRCIVSLVIPVFCNLNCSRFPSFYFTCNSTLFVIRQHHTLKNRQNFTALTYALANNNIDIFKLLSSKYNEELDKAIKKASELGVLNDIKLLEEIKSDEQKISTTMPHK